MELGPVEMLIVGFPGNNFTGEITPELKKLVDSGMIRVIDLIFVTKDADGTAGSFELLELDEEVQSSYNELVAEVAGLISDEDVEDIADALDPNTSAAMLLFEHTWATPFAEALRNAGGELIDSIRIPHDVVQAAVDARDAG